MIAFERSFWRDRKFRYYLVTVSTFGRDYGVSGGGGFANGFCAFSPAEIHVRVWRPIPSRSWNLSHLEPLPHGPGARIQCGDVLVYGSFTTYYQNLLPFRAGMLTFPEYVAQISEQIRKSVLAPHDPYFTGCDHCLLVGLESSGGEAQHLFAR